jgi:hypothetical protein
MSVNGEGFMYISRLLLFPLLFSVCLAPVAAQSLPDQSLIPQSLPTLPQKCADSHRPIPTSPANDKRPCQALGVTA